MNKGALNALSYARSLAPDRLLAVSVVGDPAEQEELTKSWDEHNIPVELHTIYSPYRELTRPVLQYLDELDQESPDEMITVIIPEFVTSWCDAVPPQPERPRAQSTTAVPAQHGRDVRTRPRGMSTPWMSPSPARPDS